MIKKETIIKVSKLFSLSATGQEQDWAIEFADKTRVRAFLNVLLTSDLSLSEKYAILSLVLASYDDYLVDHTDMNNELWLDIVRAIDRDRSNYMDILRYWAVNNEEKSNDLFNITPLIREYLHVRQQSL